MFASGYILLFEGIEYIQSYPHLAFMMANLFIFLSPHNLGFLTPNIGTSLNRIPKLFCIRGKFISLFFYLFLPPFQYQINKFFPPIYEGNCTSLSCFAYWPRQAQIISLLLQTLPKIAFSLYLFPVCFYLLLYVFHLPIYTKPSSRPQILVRTSSLPLFFPTWCIHLPDSMPCNGLVSGRAERWDQLGCRSCAYLAQHYTFRAGIESCKQQVWMRKCCIYKLM